MARNWFDTGQPQKQSVEQIERSQRYAYFKGGVLDGRLTAVKQYPATIPHIHRVAEAYTKDNVPEFGGTIVGRCKLHGEDALLIEVRTLYNYRLTTEVHGPMRAQVYVMEGSPVPVEWDDVKGEYKDMEAIERLDDDDLVSSTMIVKEPEDGTDAEL